jgi:hypothetical protein
LQWGSHLVKIGPELRQVALVLGVGPSGFGPAAAPLLGLLSKLKDVAGLVLVVDVSLQRHDFFLRQVVGCDPAAAAERLGSVVVLSDSSWHILHQYEWSFSETGSTDKSLSFMTAALAFFFRLKNVINVFFVEDIFARESFKEFPAVACVDHEEKWRLERKEKNPKCLTSSGPHYLGLLSFFLREPLNDIQLTGCLN